MKRFSDTDKWKDPWFLKLDAKLKCLWVYLLENCDQDGVIALDLGLVSYQLGSVVTPDDLNGFGDKVEMIGPDTLRINQFCEMELISLECDEKPEPKTKAPWTPDPIQKRINAIFRRRDSTKWMPKELRSYKLISPIAESDLQAIEKYYAATITEKDYRRREIFTLLNNWAGEVDKANKYRPKVVSCF